MIAQADRMIDRQIRALIETETKHRKLNNYGFGGMVLTFLLVALHGLLLLIIGMVETS